MVSRKVTASTRLVRGPASETHKLAQFGPGSLTVYNPVLHRPTFFTFTPQSRATEMCPHSCRSMAGTPRNMINSMLWTMFICCSTLARGVSLRAAPLTLPELPDSLSAGFPANFSKRYDRGLLHGMGTVLGGLAQTGALLWMSTVRNAVSDCFSEANRLTVDSPDC